MPGRKSTGICVHWSFERREIVANQYAYQSKRIGYDFLEAGENAVDQSFFNQQRMVSGRFAWLRLRRFEQNNAR